MEEVHKYYVVEESETDGSTVVVSEELRDQATSIAKVIRESILPHITVPPPVSSPVFIENSVIFHKDESKTEDIRTIGAFVDWLKEHYIKMHFNKSEDEEDEEEEDPSEEIDDWDQQDTAVV